MENIRKCVRCSGQITSSFEGMLLCEDCRIRFKTLEIQKGRHLTQEEWENFCKECSQ